MLGLNHEQQIPELILTDLKHAFAQNPLRPPLIAPDLAGPPRRRSPTQLLVPFADGLHLIGAGDRVCLYDNEQPRHRVWLACAADRPVTNAEYLAFIDDGGYREPRWWLSEGWTPRPRGLAGTAVLGRREGGGGSPWRDASRRPGGTGVSRQPVRGRCLCRLGRTTPADRGEGGSWPITGQTGNVEPPAPICAGGSSAAGCGGRSVHRPRGRQLERRLGGPAPYTAYPGFSAPHGPVGEYNGKFMSGQMVLRGGPA